MNITEDTLDKVFSYHAPRGNQTERYELLRWANASIAINES